MDKKESSFMGLVGFECPLRGQKKLLLQQEILDLVLKSISTWSPTCILNLNIEMWILKIRVPQTKIFEFLKSCISKWENVSRMNWSPLKKYIKYILSLPHKTPPPPPPLPPSPPLRPLKLKISWPPPINPKFQLSSLASAGGTHCDVTEAYYSRNSTNVF